MELSKNELNYILLDIDKTRHDIVNEKVFLSNNDLMNFDSEIIHAFLDLKDIIVQLYDKRKELLLLHNDLDKDKFDQETIKLFELLFKFSNKVNYLLNDLTY
ncbi:MAG: hypothetical protein ACOCRK_08660 [bacterium]